MRVTLLSGLPGCGKSTWVRQQPEPKVICSADDYHMVNGVYQFDPKNAQAAHNSCRRTYTSRIVNVLLHGSPLHVIVDNTNTASWELGFYVGLAEAYIVECEILRFRITPEESFRRNIHGVPLYTILSMAKRMNEDVLPPWWNVRVIEG